MKDLTKLADELEGVQLEDNPSTWDRSSAIVTEAATILRSAAGLDVAGLMAMIKTVPPRVDWQNRERHIDAIESALRLALAAREGFVMVPVEPVAHWLGFDGAPSVTFNSKFAKVLAAQGIEVRSLVFAPTNPKVTT